jgi:hypothetical protein
MERNSRISSYEKIEKASRFEHATEYKSDVGHSLPIPQALADLRERHSQRRRSAIDARRATAIGTAAPKRQCEADRRQTVARILDGRAHAGIRAPTQLRSFRSCIELPEGVLRRRRLSARLGGQGMPPGRDELRLAHRAAHAGIASFEPGGDGVVTAEVTAPPRHQISQMRTRIDIRGLRRP